MHTVYTVGYLAGWTPSLLAAAAEARNAVVVDIRINPMSRKPEWRQRALEAALPAGRYGWLREFGNVHYKTPGVITLADPERGLARLTPVLERQAVILLCACRDVAMCHRQMVAEWIGEELEVPVEHLEIKQ